MNTKIQQPAEDFPSPAEARAHRAVEGGKRLIENLTGRPAKTAEAVTTTEDELVEYMQQLRLRQHGHAHSLLSFKHRCA
ncbi:hypothetical protein [Bordetella genomosp. 2]|uniref:hypothetical protein n=1 Tax=Bordetella genomosp. 2 TaxID=1983456 RepID=UPI0011404DD1|nr:hypothetical protein [Bordetella genomosp. 2]